MKLMMLPIQIILCSVCMWASLCMYFVLSGVCMVEVFSKSKGKDRAYPVLIAPCILVLQGLKADCLWKLEVKT